MSTPEGKPNPPLTRDAAAALIRTSFPAVDAADLRYLGSGWNYDAFLTRDAWVFRFPRCNWSGGLFDAEANVHRFVAQILPSQIRLPRVELLSQPTPDFPYPIAGHRYIRGVAADELGEKLLPTLAREIAILLNALHSTPAPVAGAAGIHEFEMDDAARQWLEHGSTLASELRGLDPVVDRAIEWLSAKPSQPPFGPFHLIHGDLDPQHLLVDPDTGFLLGVIDWTETMLGDAARDFVFLVTWKGWHFVEEVLRLYPRAVDREFRTRLRYQAQLLSIIWLAYAHEQGEDITKHVRGVRNAFATE